MAATTIYQDDPTEHAIVVKPAVSPAPSFYLYGEPQRDVRKGFVHVESLDDRSRPSEWTIQPHVHRDLHHIILIAHGGGTMRADGIASRFDAPALLLVPAGSVHGFEWHSDSSGWVITLADSYVTNLTDRDADLVPLFRTAAAIALGDDDRTAVERNVSQLMLELGWIGPAQRTAIESEILAILVRALRCAQMGRLDGEMQGRHADIVARLRERIEARFRLREPVAVHARAIGVSETALRLACARTGGASPAVMLDERALLEARRLLLYTSLSVHQVAFSIGFDDPGYFARFFTRHTGRSPSRFRIENSS